MTQPRPHAPAPSVGMLMTGGVGGWLLFGAYLGFALLMVIAYASQGEPGGTVIAGMFGFLAGLTWLGGIICQIVGWFGLARIYGSTYRWAAVATIVEIGFMVVLPFLMAIAGADDGWAVFGWMCLAIVMATSFICAFVLWTGKAAPGVARGAAIGFIMAGVASIGAALLIVDAGRPDGAAALLVVLLAAGGFGLGHFGAGVTMLRAREHATVVDALS